MNLYFKPKLGSKSYFSTKRNEDVLSNTLHIEDLEELATNGTSSNNTDSDEFRCAHLPWHSVKKWAHFRIKPKKFPKKILKKNYPKKNSCSLSGNFFCSESFFRKSDHFWTFFHAVHRAPLRNQ